MNSSSLLVFKYSFLPWVSWDNGYELKIKMEELSQLILSTVCLFSDFLQLETDSGLSRLLHFFTKQLAALLICCSCS